MTKAEESASEDTATNRPVVYRLLWKGSRASKVVSTFTTICFGVRDGGRKIDGTYPSTGNQAEMHVHVQ